MIKPVISMLYVHLSIRWPKAWNPNCGIMNGVAHPEYESKQEFESELESESEHEFESEPNRNLNPNPNLNSTTVMSRDIKTKKTILFCNGQILNVCSNRIVSLKMSDRN